MAKTVFYSFHYDNDAWRVQQIVNMGALEGQTILNAQEWEAVKRQGDAAIEQWIDEQMSYKKAVVVLIGSGTANRPWVQYEIAKAWDAKKPLVGIRINGLADSSGDTDSAGVDPFSKVTLQGGGTVADYVPVYTPSGSTSQAVYGDIAANITSWVDNAYSRS
ncbi:TIR domain-containing protein [Curtobacterium sp. VKM Ac-1376]|uniref:TIR domain-containing protein n=1 Tax=Curtobacterium sp. VKM Ac-1376 TaxID=123312 RepID=UPI001889F9F4|nr:TIR domain-containing protein [Curtobacterium sp. VKM Ac-1376]MBF4616385.1 TIR domain-containing protein [Curtobacterium sp. VKM Ac-1376]